MQTTNASWRVPSCFTFVSSFRPSKHGTPEKCGTSERSRRSHHEKQRQMIVNSRHETDNSDSSAEMPQNEFSMPCGSFDVSAGFNCTHVGQNWSSSSALWHWTPCKLSLVDCNFKLQTIFPVILEISPKLISKNIQNIPHSNNSYTNLHWLQKSLNKVSVYLSQKKNSSDRQKRRTAEKKLMQLCKRNHSKGRKRESRWTMKITEPKKIYRKNKKR